MKKALTIIACLLVAVLLLGCWFLHSPKASSKFSDVKRTSGLVKISLNTDAVPAKSYGGGGITFCSIAKRGCSEFVNRIPKHGEVPSQEWKNCMSNGCLAWGIPKRERKTLELSNEQASSLVNDYKPKILLAKDIKFKFEKGKVYIQGTSLYPIAPGEATIEAIQSGEKSIKITSMHLGKVPLPTSLADQFSNLVNKWLNMEWQSARLYSMQFESNKIVLDVGIPEVLIKEIKILP